jgi:peptide-methionine (S)-S-oxide reductase
MKPAIGLLAGALLALPLVGASAPPAKTETAVLAGGCFWGTEAVYEHVKGVKNVISGYAGGSFRDAHYEDADSGHAEAVRITYDPTQISYAQLLQIFFTVAHDPTQVNRQGPDVGRSYRSAIFPQSRDQEQFAKAFIARLNGAHIFKAPIATRIEHGGFFAAEDYHQDFAKKHPTHPYIVANDEPKVAALQKRFPSLWKDWG